MGLLDCYYVLPERPDLASLFCWQAINHSYYNELLGDLSRRCSDTDGVKKVCEDILSNKAKYDPILQQFIVKLPIKVFHYVASYMPKMPAGSFAKKLYSLYLTYLPTEKFKYALNMNVDNRGSFTELVHTEDCGQVSINISRPGITKGQHWHNFKWELFIVVAGHGLIQERNINTGETVEFEISGDKIEAVHMIPGWTHNIINLSETENLVTVMTCNEIFDPGHPDTFGEPV